MIRLSVLVLLLWCMLGCKSVQLLDDCKCILVADENLITGKDKSAKEICQPRGFIPSMIQYLTRSVPRDRSDQIHIHFLENAPIQYAGYSISGCVDTTWAKQTMAEHLMKKYGVVKFDSIYERSIMKLQVINDSLLAVHRSQDDCEMMISMYNQYNEELVNTYKCIEWNTAADLFNPSDKHHYRYKVLSDRHEGKYDFSIPVDLAERQGLKGYNKYLRNYYGVYLESIGVDTVHVGVYKYSK